MNSFAQRLGILAVWATTTAQMYPVLFYVAPWFDDLLLKGRDDYWFGCFTLVAPIYMLAVVAYVHVEDKLTIKRRLIVTGLSPWAFVAAIAVCSAAIIVSVASVPFWLVTGKSLWRMNLS
jgi:hypothetical protein